MSFALESPLTFLIGAALALGAVAVFAIRRVDLPFGSRVWGAVGLACLAMGAGGPVWNHYAGGMVAVMVDLSASTRGAGYRDAAVLRRRVKDLLSGAAYTVTYFSDSNRVGTLESPPGEMGAEKTVFAPPTADAVLLFSDCQFALPAAAPPTFVVVDPGLDDPGDSAVRDLSLNARGGGAVGVADTRQSESTGGDQREDVTASVSASGKPRTLAFSGTSAAGSFAVSGEDIAITAPVTPGASSVTARLSPGDLWPENDSLSIPVLPAAASQRWWVSDAAGGRETPTTMDAAEESGASAASNASTAWRLVLPGQLPTDPAAYLTPAVIALDNVSADELGQARLRCVEQYVRDLGGSLVIFGGSRAFSAGGYQGTALDGISPLASDPPAPAMRWILLADSSGSMQENAGASGDTRFSMACRAIAGVLGRLPGDDPVDVGSFAAQVQWWSTGKTVAQTAGMDFSPTGIAPNGPTNIESALLGIASDARDAMRKELVVLTDGDVRIDDPAGLKAALTAAKIRLSVLILGSDVGAGARQLHDLCASTGGAEIAEPDPGGWAGGALSLMRQAMAGRFVRERDEVRFLAPLRLPGRVISARDRVWLKQAAAPLAALDSAAGNGGAAGAGAGAPGGQEVLGGIWNIGAGRVAALAFAPTGEEARTLAYLIAEPPRDPRFNVRWSAGRELRVTIDAIDGDHFMNGVMPVLELQDAMGMASPMPAVDAMPIPQTAPGRYELLAPGPRHPRLATVRVDGRAVDRFAISGRYAEEFDAIGNNYGVMRELAARTGGAVIPPTEAGPIRFPSPGVEVSLAPWLAAAGAMMIGMAIVIWRV